MIWALYAVGGVVTFIAWKIACYYEAKPDYRACCYIRSESTNNGLMFLFCLVGWPFIIPMFFKSGE